MQKVWFITGSARGLGKSLTAAVLAKGDLVAATARNPAQLDAFVQQYGDHILPVQLDVTDNEQVRKAVEATIARFGRIDVLVNNAGFGIIGAAEAFTDEQVHSQLETNLYAPIRITRVVLPYMRKQRAGRILQISSIGGRITSSGLSIYQSAKWGLSGFADALAKEVDALGIKVTAVEPGGFRTDWAGDSMTYATDIEGYESTIGQRTEIFRSGKFIPKGSPDKAAAALVNLADHPEPPVHLVLGSDATGLLQQVNALRQAEFERWLAVSESTDADEA
ncbi:SDR family NAD(P)-dependent oxidoreductase [Chitinophaga agri]|uniref:SDR family NAD(P)-dependent oxidoreductase n=1 Tax=Chitinophaga agri TaxID=2703787 RepID=A0A6B9ZAX2_9BACT|nr:SDR family NAD(P)-dependent oxidoreductase [Chitinophaga agri]QHS59266.1 SDR family NAD(P)-dependent oxidoreductase [Chitinophaga agri]